MRLRARELIQNLEPEKPFFLYVGMGDAHRCGGPVGEFCEHYPVTGEIPDWKPIVFDPSEVINCFIHFSHLLGKINLKMHTSLSMSIFQDFRIQIPKMVHALRGKTCVILNFDFG